MESGYDLLAYPGIENIFKLPQSSLLIIAINCWTCSDGTWTRLENRGLSHRVHRQSLIHTITLYTDKITTISIANPVSWKIEIMFIQAEDPLYPHHAHAQLAIISLISAKRFASTTQQTVRGRGAFVIDAISLPHHASLFWQRYKSWLRMRRTNLSKCRSGPRRIAFRCRGRWANLKEL
jgi:hypothetical protein